MIDHHHLALALHKEGIRNVLVTVVSDLSALDMRCILDCISIITPGCIRTTRKAGGGRYTDIPRSVVELKDDPYRSLAGELRRLGGFAKDTTPFSEFLWADFFRRRIKRGRVEKNFNAAIERAMELAKSEDARHLPGWCGPLDG